MLSGREARDIQHRQIACHASTVLSIISSDDSVPQIEARAILHNRAKTYKKKVVLSNGKSATDDKSKILCLLTSRRVFRVLYLESNSYCEFNTLTAEVNAMAVIANLLYYCESQAMKYCWAVADDQSSLRH